MSSSQRLEHLYEISKLFASFESVEQTFDAALAIVSQTLPLRSAILIERDGGQTKMIVWLSQGRSPQAAHAIKEHAEAAYSYLVGGSSAQSLAISEQAGLTPLPRQGETPSTLAQRFIVIPLVVAHRLPFGALQLEGAQRLDKRDLMFVNAIGNQLAVALDRDRAWRRDLLRRERAEAGQILAEVSGAFSESARRIAESSREKFEALASENARLYEQAQQAVRAREQILEIVAHDLRNPLGTVMMAATLLAQNEAPAPRQPGLLPTLEKIQRAAARMLRLVNDLLDFGSIAAGRLAINRQPEDPGPMLNETLANFDSITKAKQQRLTAEIEPQLPKVYCDRDRILQVLSNLVSNSTKATAEGGHISLRVQAQGPELRFIVSDNGPGIGLSDAKHLFEPYWRSHEAQYQGTGLGLGIASGIVSAHGGRIWMESEIGRGATFMFTIPAAAAAELPAAACISG